MLESRMKTTSSGLFEEERGATSIEYAIMVAAIATVIVLVVFALGLAVNGLFSNVNIP